MNYSDLTPSQQANCQRDLFHDALFNVDYTQFDYVVDGDQVTGRIPRALVKHHQRQAAARKQPVILHTTTSAVVDDDIKFRMNCAINDLARAVALLIVKQEEHVCQP